MPNNQITKIEYNGTTYDICALDIDSTGIEANHVLKADGSGGIKWEALGNFVTTIGEKSGAIGLGGTLDISDGNVLSCKGFDYVAAAPTEAHQGGGLRIAIIAPSSSSSINYQTGWLYFILE